MSVAESARPVGVTSSRRRTLAVAALKQPAALIFNPRAGQKLGLATNSGGPGAVEAALSAVQIPFEAWPTRRAGHATELARQAVQQGRELVIAAGGDGTVAEVARGLAGTGVVLGVLPLGSIMNIARTLCLPRDLNTAAETISYGQVLAMDVGRARNVHFLEAAGVGLDAGLFNYFNRADRGTLSLPAAVRSAFRFLRLLGRPPLNIIADGERIEVRAPMVVVANGPFVGAAYTIAPDALIDDGLLDLIIFNGASVPRMLVYLAAVAGGRSVAPPPHTRSLRAARIQIANRRRRPLPAHADGVNIGTTPVRFDVMPGALNILVGPPALNGTCAWQEPSQ